MMDRGVELLLPYTGPAGMAELETALGALESALPLAPFDPAAVAMLERLHQALVTDAGARLHPELQAFAFWIRPKAVAQMAARHSARSMDAFHLVPRGVVFHLPPGNVALLFAYCWSLSLLAGNRNIVRLSARKGAQTETLLRLIGDVLTAVPGIAAGQLFLTYGHDDAVTAKLSAACDLRMVWGGDETVRRLREVPLPPLANELCFPDRFSYAALKADAVLNVGEDFDALVDLFFNDVYWFDQMACSSPRLVLWVGTSQSCRAASERFYLALGHRARDRGYGLDAGVLSAKMAHVYGAMIEKSVTHCRWYGGRLAVLGCESFPDIRGQSFGGGILYELCADRLGALVPHVRAKDQTLVHYGFEPSELADFAGGLGGRGLDRLVPVGQALAFDEVWDGHDLMSAFSRRVAVLCSP